MIAAIKNGHKGLWIDNMILLRADLSAVEKILLAEIHTLQKEQGCFSSNRRFAERLGVGERRVRELIASLAERGLVRVVNGRSKRRRLFVGAALTSNANVAATNPAIGKETPATRTLSAVEGGTEPPSNSDREDHQTRTLASTENTARLPCEKKEEKTENNDEMCDGDIPYWLPTPAWRRWEAHRKEAGWKFTSHQVNAQLKQLHGVYEKGLSVEEAIDNTIAGGWRVFYPPKTSKPRGTYADLQAERDRLAGW